MDLGVIAFLNFFRPEGARRLREPLRDVTSLIPSREFWQTASLEEEIIGVLVAEVWFALANLIHNDRLKRDRLKVFSLERDMRDSAFPVDRFVELYVRGWHVKNKVSQIVKDRPPLIDFHAMQQRRAMHHDDVRACIDLFVGPFLEPIRW